VLEKVLQLLSIRCKHRKTSQPFTAAGGARASSSSSQWDSVGSGPRHYIVCLECGKKFNYDWQNMRIVS